MIKDIYKLKKKSWHTFLMRWIWGWGPDDFRNMCPYFWLTTLNVLIFLPFSVLKLSILFLALFPMAIGHAISKVKEQNRNRRYIREDQTEKDYWEKAAQGDMTAYHWLQKRHFAQTFIEKFGYDKYVKLEELFIKWREERWAHEAKLEELREKAAQEAYDRKVKRSKTIATIVNRIKFVTRIISIAVVIFVYWMLILLIDFVVTFCERNTIPWSDYGWDILYVIGWIFFGTLIVLNAYLIILLFQDPIERFFAAIKTEKGEERLNTLGRWLAYPFIKVWQFLYWIWSGISTAWEFLMAIKSSNCPGIDWE